MPTGAGRSRTVGRQLAAQIVIQRAADRLFARLLVLSAGVGVVLALASVSVGRAHRPPDAAADHPTPDDRSGPADASVRASGR